VDLKTAQIAKDTCVDVAAETAEVVGCIDFISTRDGVQGAKLSYGNPLNWGDPDWFPLSELYLCGRTANEVVAQYM